MSSNNVVIITNLNKSKFSVFHPLKADWRVEVCDSTRRRSVGWSSFSVVPLIDIVTDKSRKTVETNMVDVYV